MAREAIRRGTASPSPLSSPTPSAVAAFAGRKDASSPFIPSAAFREVASPLSASHASLSTDPVHATLSPRPMSPVTPRIDHNAPAASSSSRNALPSQAHNSASANPAQQAKPRQVRGHAQVAQLQSSVRPSEASLLALSSTNNKATERAFYRRILFQDLPASTEAPTITHDADLDHEVYLLLAYLLRETVLPWYSKLTPDREFLTQITSIITSIILTVIQRQSSASSSTGSTASTSESDIHAPRTVLNGELPRIHALLSRDIPLVLRQHCSDFRQAQSKADSVWTPLGTHGSLSTAAVTVSQAEQEAQRRQRVYEQLPSHLQDCFDPTSRTNGLAPSPLQLAQLFCAASPHPGLDPVTGSLDGKIELAYLRIAVLNLLSSLLPADEYTPDTEKFIVRDVLVTVLRGALARSFRPWFFVQSIHKTLDAIGWPSSPALASAPSSDVQEGNAAAFSPPSTNGGVLPTVVGLILRLPSILVHTWTFIVFTAIPFLLRAYFDLFNVQRAASRKKRRQLQQQDGKQDDAANHERSSSHKGTFPSSMSMGSLYERKMHGRFPSRKSQFSHDETMTAQARSSALDNNLTLTQADLAGMQGLSGVDAANSDRTEPMHDADLPPNYVGNWLDAAEEVLEASSHAVLRAVLGTARTALATTGLDETIDRMATRRINAELSDTQKLAKMVREFRRILLPDGHLPPSAPDPDVEMQEAEWIRLRTRLVGGSASSSSAIVPWLVKKVLLGSAETALHRGDEVSRLRDTQVQMQRLTTWLEPFCSPQAAGPNTLLAILVFERVLVALCPDLTLT